MPGDGGSNDIHPAYEGDAPYVFVSYAHKDDNLVLPELARLRALGINVWYDEGISPGSEWTDTLARKIQSCQKFVFFLSPNSIRSEHCRQELGFAQEEQRPIFVIALADVELSPGLRLSLNNRQIILRHRLSTEDYERKLLAAMALDVAELTPLLPEPQAPATARLPALAVLPFTDLTGESELVTQGIGEELLDQLTENPDLIIVSRAMAERSRLESDQADFILHGSLVRLRNRYALKVRLTSQSSGQLVWTDNISLGTTIADIDVQQAAADAGMSSSAVIQYSTRNPRGIVSARAVALCVAGQDAALGAETKDELLAAKKCFQDSLDIQPDFLPSFLGAGRVLLRLYRQTQEPDYFQEAEHLCRDALEMDRGFVQARTVLAALYNERGEYAEALEVAQEAVAQAPYFEAGHAEIARGFSGLDRLAEAEAAYLKCIALAPLDSGVYLQYGNFLARYKRYDEAVRQFVSMTEVDPDNFIGFGSVGVSYYEMGEWALAEDYLTQCLALRKNDIAHVNLGLTYKNQHRIEDAKVEFIKAAELNPSNYWAAIHLAELCDLTQDSAGAKKYAQIAFDLVDALCDINPKDGYSLSRSALLLYELNRAPEALERIARALAVEADNPKVIFNAAMLAHLDGDPDEAARLFAASLDNGYPVNLFRFEINTESYQNLPAIKARLQK